MTAKINQHHPLDPNVPPVRHNSGGVTSTPAGGAVSVDQYARPIPVDQGGGGPANAVDRGEPNLV